MEEINNNFVCLDKIDRKDLIIDQVQKQSQKEREEYEAKIAKKDRIIDELKNQISKENTKSVSHFYKNFINNGVIEYFLK